MSYPEDRHPDLELRLNTAPDSLTAVCVVCTRMIGPGTPRIGSYVGGNGQSDLCLDCAKDVQSILNALKRKPVEAVV